MAGPAAGPQCRGGWPCEACNGARKRVWAGGLSIGVGDGCPVRRSLKRGHMRDTTLDLARVPSATRELLLGVKPAGTAPIRLSLADLPERDRPGIYREFFGRSVFRLDVEPLRDVPFGADFTVQNLPDLLVLLGRV